MFSITMMMIKFKSSRTDRKFCQSFLISLPCKILLFSTRVPIVKPWLKATYYQGLTQSYPLSGPDNRQPWVNYNIRAPSIDIHFFALFGQILLCPTRLPNIKHWIKTTYCQASNQGYLLSGHLQLIYSLREELSIHIITRFIMLTSHCQIYWK